MSPDLDCAPYREQSIPTDRSKASFDRPAHDKAVLVYRGIVTIQEDINGKFVFLLRLHRTILFETGEHSLFLHVLRHLAAFGRDPVEVR